MKLELQGFSSSWVIFFCIQKFHFWGGKELLGRSSSRHKTIVVVQWICIRSRWSNLHSSLFGPNLPPFRSIVEGWNHHWCGLFSFSLYIWIILCFCLVGLTCFSIFFYHFRVVMFFGCYFDFGHLIWFIVGVVAIEEVGEQSKICHCRKKVGGVILYFQKVLVFLYLNRNHIFCM